MKMTVRIFAMTIALVGLATSSMSSGHSPLVPSHLSAFAAGPTPMKLPVPTCGPGVPFCGDFSGGQAHSHF